MRKDVRLGLAVGGVLFGVVLIYTLFFAGERKTGASGELSEQAAAGGTVENPVALPPVNSPLVTQTPAPNNAGGAGRLPPAGQTTETVSGTPITKVEPAGSLPERTESVSVAGPGAYNTPLSKWDWSTALETGATPPSAVGASEGDARGSATPIPGMGQQVGRAGAQASSTYVVRSGDTFWSIAQTAYGDSNYFSHVMRANPKATAKNLKAGMILTIPPRDQVVPAGASAMRQSGGELDASRQYRVRNGDSLSTISQKLYGSNAQVERIYQLNRELIGPNPSALKLNMVLKLPEPPTRSVTMLN